MSSTTAPPSPPGAPPGGPGAQTPDLLASFQPVPLEPAQIPEKFAKHVDPTSPPPMRMMAARAMVPMGPKEMVPIVYQSMLDADPKIGALARKTFAAFDDRILNAVLSDQALPMQILHAFCFSLVAKPLQVEKVLMNKTTPDEGFVQVARACENEDIIRMVTENQERLLRCPDIVRGVRVNARALRSDLDRAVDFLVREGVFLEDVPEFEDSFLRLGKSDMLEALKKMRMPEVILTPQQAQKAETLGLSAEEFILGGEREIGEEELEDALDGKIAEDGARVPLMQLPVPFQIKAAMTGSHARAIEALSSPNRTVASAGIRNPKIKENDVVKIARSKSMHEDVIRYICNNGDWTKGYSVKLSLVQNPKTPPQVVSRWMPLMRQSDLKTLSKSKQIPSQVQQQAKRLLDRRQ